MIIENCLFDCGASCSIIQGDVYKKLRKHTTRVPGPKSLRSFDDTLSTTSGACTMQIQVGHIKLEEVFCIISEKCGFPLILGLPETERLVPKASIGGLGNIYNYIGGRKEQISPKINIASKEPLDNKSTEEKIWCVDTEHLVDNIFLVELWSEASGTLAPLRASGVYFLEGYIPRGCSKIVAQEMTPSIGSINYGEFPSKFTRLNDDQIFNTKTMASMPNTVAPMPKTLHQINCSKIEQTPIDNDRLTKLIENIDHFSDLSSDRQKVLTGWLRDYPDTFAIDGDQLGFNDLIPMRIDLKPDSAPVFRRPYRIPFKHAEEVTKEITRMLEEAVIKESKSPWSSPLLVVPKKGGLIRLVIDYRLLNSLSIKNKYPLPNMELLLARLYERKVFTSMDLLSGYWQLALEEGSRKLTAFSTDRGHYEFISVPFGLQNAPSHFQAFMNNMLSGEPSIASHSYVDDVLTASLGVIQQDYDIRLVLEKFKENNLKVKLSKCSFLQSEMEFLGHTIGIEGQRPQIEKVLIIKDSPRPRNVKQVQRFLGMVGYYSKFIKNYTTLARPLQRITKKDSWAWKEEHEQSWLKLKEAISSDTLLIFPDFNAPFILTTDASGTAIGGVLSQIREGCDRPIMYMARALIPAETRYSTYEQELLGVIYCLTKSRSFIYGQIVEVKTDHQSLKWLMTNAHAQRSSRLTRWAVIMLDYDLTITHINGTSNKVADWLSRDAIQILQLDPDTQRVTSVNQSVNVIDDDGCINDKKIYKQDFVMEQSKDVNIVELRQNIEDGIQPKWPKTKPLKLANLIVEDELLFVWEEHKKQRIVVPTRLQTRLVWIVHSDKRNGHPGEENTLKLVQELYYWPNMSKDIKEVVKRCATCLRTRKRQQHGKVQLEQMTRGYTPWEIIHVDLIGPFTRSTKGNAYIMVTIDSFSKFVLLYAIERKSSEEVLRVFTENIIPCFGYPRACISDRGKEFLNVDLTEYFESVNVQHNYTAAYHPQANGKVERINGVIGNMLRNMLLQGELPSDTWDSLLGDIQIAHNNRVSRVTGHTPFHLMFARPNNLPSSVYQHFTEKQVLPPFSMSSYTREKMVNLMETYSLVNEQMDKVEAEYIGRDPAALHMEEDPIGLIVYLEVPKAGQTKLSPKLQGPYEVLSRVSPHTYKCRHLITKYVITIHKNKFANLTDHIIYDEDCATDMSGQPGKETPYSREWLTFKEGPEVQEEERNEIIQPVPRRIGLRNIEKRDYKQLAQL